MPTLQSVAGFPTGLALEFDGGEQGVIVPHDDTLSPTASLTVAAWVTQASEYGGEMAWVVAAVAVLCCSALTGSLSAPAPRASRSSS